MYEVIYHLSSAFAADNLFSLTLSLEDVRAAALGKSPVVAELDEKFAAQIADAVEARLLANPEMSSELRTPVAGKEPRGHTEVEVALTQPIRLSDFGARSSLSSLLEKAATADQRLALLVLTQDVNVTYAKAWSLQEQRLTLRRAHERASRIQEIVSVAINKGLLGKGEASLFRCEVRRLLAEQAGVEAEMTNTVAELITLSGLELTDVVFAKPNLALLPSTQELLSDAESNQLSPASRQALLERVAEQQLAVAINDALPSIAPRLLYEHAENGVDRVGVGISVPLPVFNRNQAEIAKRRGELATIRERARYINGGALRSQIAALRNSAQAAMDQAVEYSEHIIPDFQAAFNYQTKQFEAGQGSIQLVWQSAQTLLSVQLTGIELWVKAASARAKLSSLVGEEI